MKYIRAYDDRTLCQYRLENTQIKSYKQSLGLVIRSQLFPLSFCIFHGDNLKNSFLN